MEAKIILNLSETEATPLLYGTSVAKNSAEYWYHNLGAWYEAFGVPQTRGWFSWKEVGISDAAGAVGGGLGGAIAGSLIPGAGTLAGAAAGAISCGVAGSVGSAVTQVLNYFL